MTKSINVSSRIASTRVSDRIVVDSYTGEWQEALCPRKLPAVGDVVALAEDADAREFHDFSSALSEAGLVVRMGSSLDRSKRSLGVVTERPKSDDGELIIW